MAATDEALTAQDALAALRQEIDEVVATLLSTYKPRKLTDGKIVRDPVFGYHLLHPAEVNIVDSPLLQRLHYIHQTALAYLVYPSANHTRFEHSLGVATLAERIATSLNRQAGGDPVSRNDIRELRLAALLHDCGHGPFSHLSESIMSQHFSPLVRLVQASGYFANERVKLGEMLSSLIVRSEPFQQLWNAIRVFYNDYSLIDIDAIARIIVAEAKPFAQYKADIISGPFDADKLDYFPRDAHFTGIKVQIDIDRILHMIKILNIPQEQTRSIVVRMGGSHHLEQILFDKMTLYASIYHHHKIRAIECMIKGIFEVIWEDPSIIKDKSLRFQKVTDYLNLSDYEFFVKAREEDALRDRVNRILNRNILKRALIINSTTVDSDVSGATARAAFENLDVASEGVAGSDMAGTVREIRQKIFDELPSQIRNKSSVHDLWLDLPSNPPLTGDAERCKVEMELGKDPVPLRDLFPIPQWMEDYADNKWTGHVFYLPDDDADRRVVGKIAADVLHNRYGVKFHPSAVDSCFKE